MLILNLNVIDSQCRHKMGRKRVSFDFFCLNSYISKQVYKVHFSKVIKRLPPPPPLLQDAQPDDCTCEYEV